MYQLEAWTISIIIDRTTSMIKQEPKSNIWSMSNNTKLRNCTYRNAYASSVELSIQSIVK